MTGAKPMSGMVPVLNKQNTISTQPMRYKVARCVACNTLHAEFDADGCLSVWCDCTSDKSTDGDVIADGKAGGVHLSHVEVLP